jgi:nicotinate-nucleotide pyrophosphorylase (carboxylating)
MNEKYLDGFIENSLQEDVGDGDHSSISCIPEEAIGKAQLLLKSNGILAGAEVARYIFHKADKDLQFTPILQDGDKMQEGDVAFTVEGKVHAILQTERLVLNLMQRMSAIATRTHEYVKQLKGLHTRVLDTRKTTPGMRVLEKAAVKIGGGKNHRMGLFDMIMLKDNHIDYAGGIEKALDATNSYLKKTGKKLKIEIETRGLDEVKRVIEHGGADIVLLDNFTIEKTREAVKLIHGRFKTESSGGITLETLREYAECGVDYISIGALTHQINSLDMSLKAIK